MQQKKKFGKSRSVPKKVSLFDPTKTFRQNTALTRVQTQDWEASILTTTPSNGQAKLTNSVQNLDQSV